MTNSDWGEPVTVNDIIEAFKEKLSDGLINEDDFTKVVYKKQAKYYRSKQSEKDSPDNSFSIEKPSDESDDVFSNWISERPLSFVEKMEKAEMESKKPNFGDLFNK